MKLPEFKWRFPLKGRDGTVFLLSLVIASVIWLISNLSQEYSGVVSVPVTAESNIEGFSDRSVNEEVVVARCHTTGFSLLSSSLRPSRRAIKLKIRPGDLKRLSGDEFYLTGTAMNSYAAAVFGEGTSVELFITDTLFFTFPSQTHKRVPVELVKDIRYRSQYMLTGPIEIEPDSITVYGESARLESLDRVYTSNLVLSDVHSSIHGSVRLSRIKGVRFSEDEVSYTLDASRYVELDAIVPVEVRNVPKGKHLQVYPNTAKVIFRCVFPVSRDPSDSFRLFIDYEDFASSLGGRCVPRAVKLPFGVIDYRVIPEIFDCIQVD